MEQDSMQATYWSQQRTISNPISIPVQHRFRQFNVDPGPIHQLFANLLPRSEGTSTTQTILPDRCQSIRIQSQYQSMQVANVTIGDGTS